MNNKSGKTAIVDIETNAIDNPDKLWCVVVKDLETGDAKKYVRGDYGSLAEDLAVYSCIIGHNILDYDWPVLSSFVHELPDVELVDTLILSRMMHYAIEGGHSLEAWGRRLGFPKGDFDKFDEFSEEMVEYCVNDVELTAKLYEFLINKVGKFEDAIRVEHEMVRICREMREHGFWFNKEKAEKIYAELRETIDALEKDITTSFRPKAKLIRDGVVKATKYGTVSKVGLTWYDGDDYSQFTPGATYSLIEFREFNPASPTQVVERLNELGWKPTEKTKGHIDCERQRYPDQKRLEHFRRVGWKVSERNLETLPPDAPEAAHTLVQYILLKSRLSTLEEWFKAYREETHAIHGTIMPIGTWPHRVAHRAPNMGNIPTEKSIKYNQEEHRALALKYGKEMRGCWGPRPGYLQVGTDIASAHLRILAHLCNDKKMIDAVVYGRSEDGTDIHTRNKEALGEVCRDRDQSKTFIYSFINGAQAPKVAEILDCTIDEAKAALQSFEDYWEGFREFKQGQIKEDLKRGFIYGLDGRPIIFPRPNTVIAAYLLSGEAAIAKHANVYWQQQLKAEGIPFWQLNFIHDEWQTESLDDTRMANRIGECQVQSIKWAGEKFGMNCPMDGEYSIGRNWYETH